MIDAVAMMAATNRMTSLGTRGVRLAGIRAINPREDAMPRANDTEPPADNCLTPLSTGVFRPAGRLLAERPLFSGTIGPSARATRQGLLRPLRADDAPEPVGAHQEQ